ncbi:MAG: DUF3536 domain-containing protein [Acidilobus sp.]
MTNEAEKYFAVFGHFYQPPRFNPWTEEVDLDPATKPYHDWNDLVAHESYIPNAKAKVEDEEGFIEDIANNYVNLSFSFGPLLLQYIGKRYPWLLDAIVAADKESIVKRSGHGNAIAQPYAHIIMPLSRHEYRKIAIWWGIRLFERIFEREPEGFWLPETAVDNETLQMLSDFGIKFVVLSPHQVKSIIGKDGTKVPVIEQSLDTRVPYKALLPNGDEIDVVVYNRWLSGLAAFGDLLKSGELLLRRVLETYDNRSTPQLVSIAVDGETFGHHKKGGEVELARAFRLAETYGLKVTNVAEYDLTISPPVTLVEIKENTSWSCPHGVERWRSNCGCGSEIRPGWTQAWRTPLREAVDALANTSLEWFYSVGKGLFSDPLRAVLDYADVVFSRSPEVTSDYLQKHLLSLSEDDKNRALRALELIRHAMLAQSSDAWFFEDIARPEPIQSLKHMRRVVELLRSVGGPDIEGRLLEILSNAMSNMPQEGSGKDLYLRHAIPSSIGPEKLAATLAMRLLFESLPQELDFYSYRVILERVLPLRLGKFRAVTGLATMISRITWSHYKVMLAGVYYGWYNVYGGASLASSTKDYEDLEGAVSSMFSNGMIPDLVDYLSKRFNVNLIDIRGALKDEQKNLMWHIAESAMADLTKQFDSLYESYAPLMYYIKGLGLNYPGAFEHLLEYYIERSLIQSLATAPLNSAIVSELAKWASSAGIKVGPEVSEYFIRAMLELVKELREDPTDVKALGDLETILRSYQDLGLPVELLRDVQEALIDLRNGVLRPRSDDIKHLGLDSRYKAVAMLLKVKYP